MAITAHWIAAIRYLKKEAKAIIGRWASPSGHPDPNGIFENFFTTPSPGEDAEVAQLRSEPIWAKALDS